MAGRARCTPGSRGKWSPRRPRRDRIGLRRRQRSTRLARYRGQRASDRCSPNTRGRRRLCQGHPRLRRPRQRRPRPQRVRLQPLRCLRWQCRIRTIRTRCGPLGTFAYQRTDANRRTSAFHQPHIGSRSPPSRHRLAAAIPLADAITTPCSQRSEGDASDEREKLLTKHVASATLPSIGEQQRMPSAGYRFRRREPWRFDRHMRGDNRFWVPL